MSKSIALKFGELEMGLRPDLGGCVSYLRTGDWHWMRPLEGEDQRKSSCYPLVPFSNRIRNGCFEWLGHVIELERNFPPEPHAIHGHGWQAPWKVEEAGPHSAILEFRHGPGKWPWAYCARQRFSLSEGRVEMGLELENNSEERMPGGLGFHPFFPLTSDTGLQLRLQGHHVSEDCIPVSRDENHPVLGALMGGGPVPAGFDDGFDGWDGRAEITWKGQGRRLIMTAGENVGNIIFYSPENRDYFCVEPVTHMTDALNRQGDAAWPESGLRSLDPGESMSIHMTLTLTRDADVT